MSLQKKPSFGDFSHVASTYAKRPPYSKMMLQWLVQYVRQSFPRARFADIGAGTGAIAYALADIGLSGYAIEPNAEMVRVGRRSNSSWPSVTWINAPGENTSLGNETVDWVCYSSSFHWTEARGALEEAIRILTPGGHLTIIYQLMDLSTDPFHIEVESGIRELAPALKRARAPIIAQMETYEQLLGQHPGFGDCLYMGMSESIAMSKDEYVNYWAGSHDIPSQVDQWLWHEILKMIGERFSQRSPKALKFRSTAWHVQRS